MIILILHKCSTKKSKYLKIGELMTMINLNNNNNKNLQTQMYVLFLYGQYYSDEINSEKK